MGQERGEGERRGKLELDFDSRFQGRNPCVQIINMWDQPLSPTAGIMTDMRGLMVLL